MSNEFESVVFVGGRVRVDENTTVAALGVRDRRVVAVGEREDVLSRCPGARVIDVNGLLVVPGLIDAHPHALHYGLFEAPLVDIKNAGSWPDIVAAVRERAASTPAGEWIMTTPVGEEHYFVRRSWRDLTEGRLPDASVLDEATTDHPVMVQAWAPETPNIAVFNSAALALLGIDRDTPDNEGGVIVEKDGSGEPTGRLSGSVNNYYNHTQDQFWRSIWTQIPYIQPPLVPAGLASAIQGQHALGVTTIYEAHSMDAQLIGAYIGMNRAGALNLRVLASIDLLGSATTIDIQVPDEAQLLEDLATAEAIQGDYGEMLRVRGVTLTATGPIPNGHMVMRQPYVDYKGHSCTGHWVIPQPLLEKAIRAAAERGLRVNFCGGGLGEHDFILGYLDKLRDDGVIDGSEHWIFQHSFFLAEEQAERYADHGFRITVAPGATTGDGPVVRERMGADLLADWNPFRRMVDAGIPVAASTDWGPKNPWDCMALSVTHELGKGPERNDGPAQVVTRQEAYAMWGRKASEVLEWEGIGDLRPGSYADVVLLDRDPVECPIEDLPGTQVIATLVGGRVVSGALPEVAPR
ncbi:amidohydrolase [Nocardia sp. CA-084685]|uniref:amidohydrolase n=1 Tax=Nocardia sp. CA-084685 TaxID=3239970 RepID=UPI003D98A9A4